MKQFAAWQAPFYSFWSKSFYADIAKNWRGLAYGYLFAVICFTWIFIAIRKQLDMNYLAEHDFYIIADQMPKVTIEKGVLSIDRPSPYTIKNRNDVPVITFDTREKTMDLKEIPGNFLVTKNSVLYKSPVQHNWSRKDQEDQKLDLSTIDQPVVITKETARQFISDFCRSIGLIVFMIAVPIAFVFCAIQTLLYALIGLLIARIYKADLSYGSLIRLSAVALTPVLLIDSIIKVRGIDFELWPIFALFISIGYLAFAISANVNQNNKAELSNY